MDNTQNEKKIAHVRSSAERIQADFDLDFSLASSTGRSEMKLKGPR